MNLKIARLAGLFITFCAFAASPVYSQNKSVLRLADEYALVLRKYQAQKSRQPVENVLRKGKAVAEKLDELESLSDAEYALLEKKMKGFVVNRDEVLYIKPDLKFFAQLAQTRGTEADAAFFAVMREIRPENVWTAYYDAQTDVSGCTIYGKGVLSGLYGKTLQFKRAFPKAYASEIDEEIDEILDKFTADGVCSCGASGGVRREFRLFIKSFPKDKNTSIVRKRLANLEKNKANRFNCQTG
ncbi:MAG TPA: hypothetical protein VF599_25150 [Pyrinomonadaceae bacterium]|jgi:hypothetical protein